MGVIDILKTHPSVATFDPPELAEAIDKLGQCVAFSSICADSCLHEDDIASMRDCIKAGLNCADVCSATMRVVSRPGPDGGTWSAMLKTCTFACEECAAVCETHSHDHCAQCAQACRSCAKACKDLLAVAS